MYLLSYVLINFNVCLFKLRFHNELSLTCFYSVVFALLQSGVVIRLAKYISVLGPTVIKQCVPSAFLIGRISFCDMHDVC